MDKSIGDRVGEYFVDENGEMWKLIGYCSEPTITIEHPSLGKLHVGADSPVAKRYKPLGTSESKAIDQYREQLRRGMRSGEVRGGRHG